MKITTKKIWVIYDSKYGNNEVLAAEIKKALKIIFTVKIGYARSIKPHQVIQDRPYGIILGGPIRFGRPSLTMTRWIRSLSKIIKKIGFRPKKAETYCTAYGDPEKGQLLNDLATQLRIAQEVDPNCMGLLVETLKGPLKPHEIQKFTRHIQNFFSISINIKENNLKRGNSDEIY